MYKKLAIVAVLAMALNCSADPLFARTQKSSGKTIIIYSGIVNSRSAKRLLSIISQNTDKIIGLKLTVEKSDDADETYYSSLDGDQLNITSGNPTDGPAEVIINGGVGTTGAGAFLTADGFYLIKSGGSHAAGAISYGAIAVSEANIRLDTRVHVVTRKF